MNILVCYKVTVDYDKVSPKEILRGDFSYAKKGYGFFDEGALSLALKYKEKYGAYVEALTFGTNDEICEDRLYALGYDKVTVISGNDDIKSVRFTANILKSYIKKGEYDLILTGDSVPPNESGAIPYFLGELLSYPVIADVKDFDDKFIYSESEKSDIKYEINKGLVLIIKDSVCPYLKFPKYSDQLKTKDMKAHILIGSDDTFKGKLKEKIIPKKDVKDIDISKLKDILGEVKYD